MDIRSAVDTRRMSGERDAGVRDRFQARDPSDASSFTANTQSNVSMLLWQYKLFKLFSDS